MRARWVLAGAVLGAVALVLGGCGLSRGTGGSPQAAGGSQQASGGSPGVEEPGAGAGVLMTPGGVAWSVADNVYRSVDGGRHWSDVLAGSKVPTSLGFVASWFSGDDDAWLAEEGAGLDPPQTTVLRTTDGGRRWERSFLPTPPVPGASVLFESMDFANPSDGWLLGALGASSSLRMVWWGTTDGGAHWKLLAARSLPAQGTRVLRGACPDNAGPQLSFTSASDGWFSPGACSPDPNAPRVWRTSDGGKSWSSAPLPAPASGWGSWDQHHRYHGGTAVGTVHAVATAGGATGTLVVPVGFGRSGVAVEGSSDGGRNWRLLSTLGTGGAAELTTEAATFDPLTARTWVEAAPGGVYRTTDAGHRWTLTRTDTGLSTQPVSFVSTRDGLQAGDYATIAYRTADGGSTWTASPEPTSTTGGGASELAVAGPHFAAAGGAGGLAVSLSSGRRWVERLGPADPVVQLDPIGAQAMVAVTADQLLVSTDAGGAWRPLPLPLSGAVSSAQFWSATSGAVRSGGQTLVTTDSGRGWRPLALPVGWVLPQWASDDPPMCFAADGTADGAAWAVAERAGRSEVLVSTDAARSWRVTLPASRLPAGASVGLAACHGRRAYLSVDQVAGRLGMGQPVYTADLLAATDLGHSWRDILRTPAPAALGLGHVARPDVPAPGGPPEVDAGGAQVDLLEIRGSALWITVRNQLDGSLRFVTSADGGARWSLARLTSPGPQASTPPGGLPAAYPSSPAVPVSSDALRAWIVVSGGKTSDSSGLYETSDGGRSWERMATVDLGGTGG